jgi:hypothetical protein
VYRARCVFVAEGKCLLGIVSRKIFSSPTQPGARERDIPKYSVPTRVLAEFECSTCEVAMIELAFETTVIWSQADSGGGLANRVSYRCPSRFTRCRRSAVHFFTEPSQR